jgi:hypothetical protein
MILRSTYSSLVYFFLTHNCRARRLEFKSRHTQTVARMTPLQFRLVRILYVARLDGKEAIKRSAKGTEYSRGRISGARPTRK